MLKYEVKTMNPSENVLINRLVMAPRDKMILAFNDLK